MVKVFFESNGHADLVAVFETEELYMACLPILEYQAKENRMIVTESLIDTDLSEIDLDNPSPEVTFATHNDKSINVGGTSLMGYITVTFEKLVDTFGEPTKSDGYKSDAEWDIEFKDGTVATIYNWKNGRNYNGCDGEEVESIIDWHIGGKDKNAVHLITKALGLNTK